MTRSHLTGPPLGHLRAQIQKCPGPASDGARAVSEPLVLIFHKKRKSRNFIKNHEKCVFFVRLEFDEFSIKTCVFHYVCCRKVDCGRRTELETQRVFNKFVCVFMIVCVCISAVVRSFACGFTAMPCIMYAYAYQR